MLAISLPARAHSLTDMNDKPLPPTWAEKQKLANASKQGQELIKCVHHGLSPSGNFCGHCIASLLKSVREMEGALHAAPQVITALFNEGRGYLDALKAIASLKCECKQVAESLCKYPNGKSQPNTLHHNEGCPVGVAALAIVDCDKKPLSQHEGMSDE